MVVLAKALSGGLIPMGAVLLSEPVYHSVFDSLRNSIIHALTFSENSISMRAGLATLAVLEKSRLGQRALQAGKAASAFPQICRRMCPEAEVEPGDLRTRRGQAACTISLVAL
jgi:adenosylmethionine-8-amino-7-oxononanoate aminotransferase